MSWVGTAIGRPWAGDRMLLDDSMRMRASACASTESGRWTAIWSPSKSALKAVQTSGCSWMALPSMRIGLEGLDAQAVQRRRAVQHDRVLGDDLFEDVPDFGELALHQLLGRLDVLHLLALDQAAHDEGLEELQGHGLGDAALVQLELRAGHDDRTAGVVHALAQQVLAEAALLAFEHVGERLERAVARAGDGPAAAAVVEQRVDRFLQHALLVVDDDLGRAQVEQPLEPVVAVDHPAIEVVEVGGGEAAAVELHHGPQFRRDDRDGLQDHPFRLVVGPRGSPPPL